MLNYERGRGQIGRLMMVAVMVTPGLSACTSYRVPGRAADFHALGLSKTEVEARTDAAISEVMNRKPLAAFPASIAVAHVQGPAYTSYSYAGHGQGKYTLVSLRESEREGQMERLAALPMIANIGPLNRLVAPEIINDQMDLRRAAAQVQADMLLLYTFDTRFGTETLVPGIGTITLGLFPAEQARVTSTASAALIDTRSGYAYWLGEATAKKEQLANLWTSRDAVDQSRRGAEAEALKQLVVEFEGAWKSVVERFTSTGASTSVQETRPSPSFNWNAADLR